MIRLARSLSRTALGIGCAIGLVLNTMFLPLVESANAAVVPATALQPAICVPNTSLPSEVQNFIAVQCSVHAAIFGDQTDPSAGYTFVNSITSPGTYTGTDHLGRPVTLHAILAKTADLTSGPPELLALASNGAVINNLVGTLTGPAGSIPVCGTQMYRVSADTGYVFVVGSTLTTAQLDTLSVSLRITAGARFVNTATGKSMSLSEARNAGLRGLWANGSDLSTVYGTLESDTEPDWECIEQAYASFNITATAAEQSCAACLHQAYESFAIAMVLCVAVWAVGGGLTTFIIAGICIASVIANLAIQVSGCNTQYEITMRAALAQLALDLAACGGITIVEN